MKTISKLNSVLLSVLLLPSITSCNFQEPCTLKVQENGLKISLINQASEKFSGTVKTKDKTINFECPQKESPVPNAEITVECKSQSELFVWNLTATEAEVTIENDAGKTTQNFTLSYKSDGSQPEHCGGGSNQAMVSMELNSAPN